MRISDWSSDVCSSDLSRQLLCVFSAVIRLTMGTALTVVNRGGQLRDPTLTRSGSTAGIPRNHRVLCRVRGVTCVGWWTTWLSGSPSALTRAKWSVRSEEHTSELQSLMRISYAVFCLKKKK